MADEYSDDFEQEETSKEEVVEEEHHLRLSLEVHSIKDLQEPLCMYVKYNYPLLGNGKTQSFQVTRNSETRIENSFQAHEFGMTKSQLYPTLNSKPLVLEVWNADKYTKDTLVGQVSINLNQLLCAPLKKTPQSVVRVLDTWAPIQGDNKVGQLRVVLYLEDLGPKTPGVALAQQANDYQAAWELELWRRAEEAKWQATLKDREQTHLASMAKDWQMREEERERQFQKALTEVNQLETRLRSKAHELQKRENKIVSLEEQLRQKMNETAHQLSLKEEEIQLLKSRFNEHKNTMTKENKILQNKLSQAREELSKAEEELYRIRREQDTPAVQNLRNELQTKHMENLEFSRQLEQMTAAKDTFKQQCEKLKSELVRVLRAHEEERKNWEAKEREELQRIKLQYESSLYQQYESSQITQLKETLTKMQKPSEPPVPNIINKPIPQNPHFFTQKKEENPQGSEASRIKQERDNLISSGIYTEDDALIQELDRQIAALAC